MAKLCKELRKPNLELSKTPPRAVFRALFALELLFERIVKIARLESGLPMCKAKGVSSVRNLGPVVLLVLILAANSFAAPTLVKSSVFPEPGLLALLGGGLVGLATLIRRHLSD
jgi:hypothetical protein